MITPLQPSSEGNWPDRRRRDPRSFKETVALMAARRELPTALEVPPQLLGPGGALEPLPVSLRISFYAEHQPLEAPPSGTHWDALA